MKAMILKEPHPIEEEPLAMVEIADPGLGPWVLSIPE